MLTLTVWLGWQHHSHLWAWLPPVIVASFAPWIARLYQFQSIPVSVLALSSLGPLIVSLLDTAAVRRSWGGWARMMMAAGIASLFVAVILWQVVQATASHDEW